MTLTQIRVVVVAHGPPLKGGIATVALDLVEDPGLNAEFEMVFLNTAQNDSQRGKLALANVKRAAVDAINTFRLARTGTVVHSHSVQDPWLVAWRQVFIALAARLRGARVLLHNHNQAPYMEPPGDYQISRLNRLAFAVLDKLVAANILIAAAGEPNIRQYMPTVALPVIANSVVVETVPQSSAVHDPAVILFIGEILERKGIVILLDALDQLDAEGIAPYELRIIGDNRAGLDPLKDEMVSLIGSRGRGQTMTGPLPRSEVYQHLSEADLYVFPTFTEGQPFTVIEALAAGVPIVASDIQAISNMIEDGVHGRLVSLDSTAQKSTALTSTSGFSQAIAELLADPEQRSKISEANRALAMQRFDRAVFRERIAELYRQHGRPAQ
ncbi:MAG: glycosyltransferase family 4 protein [Microthrixaceae bacterium]